MYKFVDPIASGAQSTSLSLQTIFNGVNLDDALTDTEGSFQTLSVSGRGILGRRIKTKEINSLHGVREGSFTYEPREIIVKYKLKDKTNEGFRERFNNLNAWLLGSKRRLEFTDERAYFTATVSSGDLPEEDSNELVGTIIFFCSDPAKYKKNYPLEVSGEFERFRINGQSNVPWTSKTTFTAASQSFSLENNQGGKIVLKFNFIAGDILEIDYEKRKVTLNGNALQVAIQLQTVWFELQPGQMELRASHPTKLSYTERYY